MKSEQSQIVRQLINDDELANKVLSRISIDYNVIAKKASEYIKVPEPEKVDYKKIKDIVIKDIVVKDGVDGKDADEVAICEKIEEDLILELPKYGEQFRDGLELIQIEDDKLKIEAIGHLREELDLLKQTGGSHTVIGANRSLYQLLDVDVDGITTDQSIKWDGQKWIPYTPTDLDQQTLQSVTGFGATTTIESTFSSGLITNQLKGVDTSGITVKNQ